MKQIQFKKKQLVIKNKIIIKAIKDSSSPIPNYKIKKI